MDIRERIEKTKQGFEKSFKEASFYNKQTRDEQHLELILECLDIEPGMRILDLGTGMGYLAFPLAERYPQAQVTGLDIVEMSLTRTRRQAVLDKLDNLSFVCYDGIRFPFSDCFFDVVVSRYALHHFPAIYDTFAEISRVLKPGGMVFVSDPAPNENDTEHFVDEYMQMKEDGHVKFYTQREWMDIAAHMGLKYERSFETMLRFPRKKTEAGKFADIAANHPDEVIKGYEIEFISDEIWITERVNNLLFKKGEE